MYKHFLRKYPGELFQLLAEYGENLMLAIKKLENNFNPLLLEVHLVSLII